MQCAVRSVQCAVCSVMARTRCRRHETVPQAPTPSYRRSSAAIQAQATEHANGTGLVDAATGHVMEGSHTGPGPVCSHVAAAALQDGLR